MSKYRKNLPQLSGGLFLTDGGIETTLIFHDGFELPEFAAFVLLEQEKGLAALDRYYNKYAAFAQAQEIGFILESPTWRANPDWAHKLGYSLDGLANVNQQAINLMVRIRNAYETDQTHMVISGCIGPRGDGYNPTNMMTAVEAEQYHITQIGTFSETEADMVSAITMNYAEEAIGITHAAQSVGLPTVISFTVETDGYLPSGQSLEDAIKQVDEATENEPAYYMINCAHPTHFKTVLDNGGQWTNRIGGLRANASSKSHAELDEATHLDEGNPVELGAQYQVLKAQLKNLNVLGGCCGTDQRHIEAIYFACKPATP